MSTKDLRRSILILVTAASLFTACAQSSSPTTPPPATAAKSAAPTVLPAAVSAATPAAASAPTAQAKPAAKPEGTLTVAVASLYEENFLPHNGSATGQEYRHPIYDTPVVLKHDTWELLPGLFTKWELSADALTWTFNVRKGVKFSNGDDLTAEDIKYTFELLMAKDSQSPRAGAWRTDIKSIDVVDPYLMKVNFNNPIWGFLEDIASGGTGAVMVVDKKYVEKVGLKEADAKPIGSGPFKLIEHKRGEYVKFEALDDHWRVVPEFKTLIVRAVPEEATRMAMLQTGEVDVAAISASSVDGAKKAGLAIKTAADAYSDFATLAGPWETSHPFYKPNVPWAKKEVREALTIAINRDDIIQHIYQGYGKASMHYLMSPGWQDLKPYPYDPARAKTLLAQAGFPNGFELKMTTFKGSPGVELPVVGEAVASFWDKIGVKVTIQPSDLATILPDIRKGATAGTVWLYHMLRKSDYEGSLILAHSPGQGGGFQLWHDDNLTKMLDELSKLRDPKARDAKMREMTKYNYDNFTVVPLAAPATLFAMSKKTGAWPLPEGGYNTHLEYVTHATPLGTFRLFTP